jgi:xanthine dehydrogenase YagS FAD-binding subunit
MKAFQYERPATLDEAIALLAPADPAEDGRHLTKALAGGTDLLTLMKEEIVRPGRLVDLKRLPELGDTIELTADGLRIGALATLAELQTHPLVRDTHPALAEAADVAATPQLRNMATLGGNLLQRPRCWYFRDEEVSCWLKGGDSCPAVEGENQYHAILGESPCRAVHPSDPATALLALDARVVLRGRAGERSVGMEAFFAEPTADRRTETTLGQDEVIVAVVIPDAGPETRSTYLKAMDRAAWAFALVGAGVQLAMQDGIIVRARIALGGVATIPWRASEAEGMLVGQAPGEAVFAAAADAALAGAHPLAKNGYKVPLAKALLVRALTATTTTSAASA